MKRIFFLLFAFSFMVNAPIWAEETASAETEQASASDEKDSLAAKLAAHKESVTKLQDEIAALKDASKSFISRTKRLMELASEKVKSAEKSFDEYQKLLLEKEAFLSKEYVFQVIPEEDRNKFEQEGDKLLKAAMKDLTSKVEKEQIRGLAEFEEIRDAYQGLPKYKESYSQYHKVLTRLAKKWNNLKERMIKDRQKFQSAKLTQTQEIETAQYEKMEQKLKSAGKDINKDWFVPNIANLPMLERICYRAKQSLDSSRNTVNESAGKVPELIMKYWESMDAARSLMMAGNLEAAKEKIDGDESFRELNSLNRNCMPDEYKDAFRKQQQDFKDELRDRTNGVRKIDQKINRAISSLDRDFSSIEMNVDRVNDELTREKEDIERKAEEAAAAEAERKALEEEERRAEEAAAAAAESAAQPEDDQSDSEE